MQKLLLTGVMLLCAFTIAYFTFNFNSGGIDTQAAIAVSGTAPIEVLFEHQLNQETFMLYRTKGGDDLSLAFMTRNLTGVHVQATATQYDIADLTAAAGLNYVVLPRSEDSPNTVFAGWTTDPSLHEVFVTEPGFPIAHAIRVFESEEVPGVYVWMVISPDFSGTDYAITATDTDGTVVSAIEYDGVERAFLLN